MQLCADSRSGSKLHCIDRNILNTQTLNTHTVSFQTCAVLYKLMKICISINSQKFLQIYANLWRLSQARTVLCKLKPIYLLLVNCIALHSNFLNTQTLNTHTVLCKLTQFWRFMQTWTYKFTLTLRDLCKVVQQMYADSPKLSQISANLCSFLLLF